MITLTFKEQPKVPLEAEVISPDVMAELSHEALRALPVFHGKRQCRLDDFFEIQGERSDDVVVRGDAGRVKWIGRGMTRGRLSVHGNTGMHLGAYMKGGAIEVHGNAGDWVGGEMIADSRQCGRRKHHVGMGDQDDVLGQPGQGVGHLSAPTPTGGKPHLGRARGSHDGCRRARAARSRRPRAGPRCPGSSAR